MPRISNSQLLPPKSWEEFEDICFELWKSIWKDPNTHKNGRKGQPQAGVDIYGQPSTINGYVGVQCKGKDQYLKSSLSEKEIDEEIEKAKTFKPALKIFIFATTQPRDVKLQEYIRLKNDTNKRDGFFEVNIFFWEDIQGELENQKTIVKKYWGQFFLKEETTGVEIEDEFLKEKKQIIEKEQHIFQQQGAITNNVYYLNNSLKSVITEKYNSDIDYARDLVLNHKPGEALLYLESLKKKEFGRMLMII